MSLAMAKLMIAGSVFLVLFAAERLHRAATPPASRTRLVKNAVLWGLVLLLSPLIVAPLVGLGANEILWQRPEASLMSAAVVLLVVDLILLDIWTYWLHRAYHKIPFLWRFHEVHHRDEFLDTTSAVRFHIGEVAISALLRLIPIALLAIPITHILLFETLLLCSALFHHSNVKLPASLEKRLSLFIVTPSIHWVHHHAVRKDTDSNYASILSVWDRLFKTRSNTERSVDMKIGTEDKSDVGAFELIALPFRGARQ